ncbi:general secretion pathway protein GspD [Rugosibacter aromaticivorans]|uniref:General secretion pathway protein GspD n=1 Tax=Rugosibacter aromaticivorans TaxID=1565605 RepID=A0A0C5JJN9_9PROT|nr:pilus (MSHA type) biogenesis protein MshL [Rugosibacter aromaticivorans]AJP47536.1 general secretion pathway protein GspD [Rugosibacter aromaticivorans]
MTNLIRWLAALCILPALMACSTTQRKNNEVLNQINDVLLQSTTDRKARPAAPDTALMPSLARPAIAPPSESRFDLSVVDAPAPQVFMALVSGTPYSMLLPPDVSGNITINLKNVTVLESLDTIRELFGYEYRIQGKRIFIESNTMQTRVFQINYLASRRQGSSDLRVTANSITTGGGGGARGSATQATQATAGGGAVSSGSRSNDASRVSMTTDSDFWGDLKTALTAILGTTDGRSVVINPASGVVVVRAMPGELANVDKYLRATQLIADRQVMIEAKIVDVALSEGYQSGINWSTFNGKNRRVSAGVVQPGTILRTQPGEAITGIPSDAVTATNRVDELFSGNGTVLPGAGGLIAATALGQGFLGLAFQSANFAALLNFLETQGSVTVLSSPRIATVNNQKAVLKVGTDELFITNLTTSTTTTTTGTVVTPSLTLEPYFSGISLDVTPQIDDEGNIILHVHPMVSVVSEKNKTVSLGTLGSFSLPLATSNINETDSIVRVQDGNIVAIGGLMRQEQSSDRSQLPGATGVAANLLGQRSSGLTKRELVILIKTTIIRNDQAWAQDINAVQERLKSYQPAAESKH